MGILSGSDNSGQKNQRKENRRAQEYMEGQLNLGIDDLNRGYNVGDAYRTDVYNQALNAVGQGAYGEMDYLRRGNVGAQQTLIDSMPTYQAALFGMPVDYSQFMAQDLGMPSRSDFSARLPQPSQYPDYGGVDYEGNAYPEPSAEPSMAQRVQQFGSSLAGNSPGPWASMAYSLPGKQAPEPSMAGKIQQFGERLAGRETVAIPESALSNFRRILEGAR